MKTEKHKETHNPMLHNFKDGHYTNLKPEGHHSHAKREDPGNHDLHCTYDRHLRVDFTECSGRKRKAFFYFVPGCMVYKEKFPLPKPIFDIDCNDPCVEGF